MLTTFKINEPDVIHQLFEQEVVVVDLRTGAYFSLNAVGAAIWMALAEQAASIDELVVMLPPEWRISTEHFAQELQDFIDQLLSHDLIQPAPEQAEPIARARVPSTSPIVESAVYETPMLRKHNDLQDLFLLDPVHEVDPSGGWPYRQEGDQRLVLEASSDPDVMAGTLAEEGVLINRASGVYALLGPAALALWRTLRHAPVSLKSGPFADSLQLGGFAVPVHDAGAAAQAVPIEPPAEPLNLLHDLEDTMRPWIPIPRPGPTPATSADESSDLVDGLEAYAAAVASRLGRAPTTRHYRIGGRTITLRTIPGQDGETLGTALIHRVIPDPGAPPDLTINVFRASDLPVHAPLARLLLGLHGNWTEWCGPRGEVLSLQSGDVTGHFDPGTRLLTVLERSSRRAWQVKRDDTPLPFWEIGSPLRFLFHEWFADQGLQMLHGACVGTAHGGVLLAGKGGVGKSTTALLCAAAGLHYVGDDYCLADPGRGWIHSLYATGKITTANDFQRLPELRGRAINADAFERGGTAKAVVSAAELWPDRLAEALPLRALLVPQVELTAPTGLVPCSAGEALLALLPSTVGQLPAAGEADCRRLVALCEGVPSFRLRLGPDSSAVPGLLSALLAS